MKSKRKLIIVSLNELNFEVINKYIQKYSLNNLAEIKKNISFTHSETEYKLLEPWIQWVSFYYGKKFKEHNVFRLGEKIEGTHKNVFQIMEEKGFKVGIISAMNIFNNLKKPDYFIPDPWTETKPDNDYWSKILSKSISSIVKDNARSKFDLKSLFYFFVAFLKFARIKNYLNYIMIFFKSFKKKWFRPLFLDLFLHDFHIKKLSQNNTDLTNIFFNSIAHIQHHYFFNSLESQKKNPEWYLNTKEDPLKDALILFDKILEDYFLISKKFDILIATGLRQIPYDREKFYYRLKNHKSFFSYFGLNEFEVQELMSRDFILKFKTSNDAENSLEKIRSIKTLEGEQIFGDFQIKNSNLFLSLVFNKEIDYQKVKIEQFDKNLSLKNYTDFVAIKNGMHDEKGYLYFKDFVIPKQFQIEKIKDLIIERYN